MVETKREAWHEIVKRAEDAGADGLELNFGCPHGMSERGMGAAVGQVPEYTSMITELGEGGRAHAGAREADAERQRHHRTPARAAREGGADGLSLINTINSIIGVDLDTLVPRPTSADASANGGYCGPAVKPIALHMVSALARDPSIEHADLRHRRHLDLARRGRVHRCSGADACRSAPPSCTTASASSRT